MLTNIFIALEYDGSDNFNLAEHKWYFFDRQIYLMEGMGKSLNTYASAWPLNPSDQQKIKTRKSDGVLLFVSGQQGDSNEMVPDVIS